MAKIDYKNAVVVVTGGGHGIGRSIVLSCAERGAAVVVADIRVDAAAAVAKEAADLGVRSLAVATDVSDRAQMDNLADEAYNTFGKVDILVNNAGVTIRPYRALWDGSVPDFEFMTNINYYGVVNGLRSFLPRMRQQTGRRHIVNTSSFATLYENPGHSMYTGAKAAVNGLSDVLREEFIDLGEDIGVTVLFPGLVTTGIGQTSEKLRPAIERGAERGVPEYQNKRPYDQPHHKPLGPDAVGPMALRAIDADAPYCVTHPAPVEYLRRKVDLIAGGYFPVD